MNFQMFNWTLNEELQFGNPLLTYESDEPFVRRMGAQQFQPLKNHCGNYVEGFLYTKLGFVDVFLKCTLTKEWTSQSNYVIDEERVKIFVPSKDNGVVKMFKMKPIVDTNEIDVFQSPDFKGVETSWWEYRIKYQELPERLMCLTFSVAFASRPYKNLNTEC